MVDTSGQPIMAVFHSNSGGQTANSEDVWGKAIYYLRSVNDPYSIGQNSYSWQKTMPRTEWLEYLRKNYEYPINIPSEVKQVTSFQQAARRAYLVDNISLRKVREDLKLRSTFFNISEQDDQIVFSGKGFGHGVGMSQEGAMNMARQGFNYIDILKFYYLGIEITTLDQISPTE
jgi:stage II sporulation protein D